MNTLIFLHGFPLNRTMWNAQLEAFGQKYRVLVPDLRGFGNNPAKNAEKITMQSYAEDLLVYLADQKVKEPVTIVGFSMGGYIAFPFIFSHPEKVHKLVLCDTRAIADSPEGAKGREKLAKEVLEKGPEPAVIAMIPKLFCEKTIKNNPALVEKVQKMMRSNSKEGIAAALRGMAVRPDVTQRLKQISCPTLVIVGQEDAISTPDEMKKIADGIPRSKYVVVPEAGHMSPMENPGFFNEALRRHIL